MEQGNRNTRWINKAGHYLIRGDDDILQIDTTNGSITLQLPSIYGSGLMLTPKTYFIIDSSGYAATTPIIITTSGSDTINGASHVNISVADGILECDVAGNTEWLATGSGIAGGSTTSGLVVTGVTSDNLNYTGTLTGITSYAQLLNVIITLIIPAPNVGATTLNINSLGVININKFVNVATEANDYKASQRLAIIYDGTNFQILSVTCNIGDN